MPNDRPDRSKGNLNYTGPVPNPTACGLMVIDEQRRLFSVNPEAERLVGLQASQALEQPLQKLPVELRQIIDQTFSTRKSQQTEILCVDDEGGEFIVQASSSPARSGDGKWLGVIVVLNDLTAVRKMEMDMRHMDRLASIGTLSANMAHEIKNALVAVRTFVELLIQKNKDAELAEIVNREIHRIDSIVSQMLRFAGPAKPTFSTLHLHELLEHSLRLVEPQLAAKKVHLKKSLGASPDLMQGDGYQLQQVLLNLFFNALEAMGAGGELSLSTDLSGEASTGPQGKSANTCLRLRIQDTGTGIAPENLAKLFDPFFTTKKNGIGLGLSITRRIIQEHSGTITVESQPNQGTTFTILLPCVGK